MDRKQLKTRKRKRALILSGGGARGAYQVGVWKFLLEIGWTPDLICGTSVGALNATGIGCGLSLGEMIQLWRTIERNRVYRISLWTQIRHFLSRRGFTPIMETEPLRQLLEEKFIIQDLRNSNKEIIITAVNIIKAQLKYFNHRQIDIEHVMASSAIPVFFPWQYIDGVPHWDGGVMANTPILPALERDVKEIIVVLLSPVGGSRLRLPRNRREAIERVFEQSLIGSYEAFMGHLSFQHKVRTRSRLIPRRVKRTMTLGDVKIATVSPGEMLGFHSILNFSVRQADNLISEGYIDARNQLARFFGLDDSPY